MMASIYLYLRQSVYSTCAIFLHQAYLCLRTSSDISNTVLRKIKHTAFSLKVFAACTACAMLGHQRLEDSLYATVLVQHCCLYQLLTRGFLNYELQVVSCELPPYKLVKFERKGLIPLGNYYIVLCLLLTAKNS